MPADHISGIIEMLQNARARPGMFFHMNPSGLLNFLFGVRSTCHVFGLMQDHVIQKQVTEEHGYQYTAKSPWVEMEERGLDDFTVIDEVLQIEIDIWRRIAEKQQTLSDGH